jgi:hypothetical protein
MIIDRLLDLSVLYYVKSVFVASPFIHVEDGYPETAFTLPTIAVEISDIDTIPSELGDRVRRKMRTWYIDVFANDKAQRDEYAYKLMSAFEQPIPVYNYDEGFPPTSSPSQIGCISTDDIKLQIIKVLPELTEKMYYRSLVIFTGEYSPA